MKKYKTIITILAILTWFVIMYLITKIIIILYFAALLLILILISYKIRNFIIYLWTKFGELLGFINSRIVLFILFYLFITPYSVILRLVLRKSSILAKNELTSFIKKEHTYGANDFENMW